MRAFLNSTTYAYENIDYLTTGIYYFLPEIIKNSIIDTTVVSGNDISGTTITTTDKLYLLSTHEVWEDVDGNANDGPDYVDTAYNNTRQLDYYEDLYLMTLSYSGAIKQKNGFDFWWFLRSVSSDSTIGFYGVYAYGGWSDNIAGDCGVSPAFRIG